MNQIPVVNEWQAPETFGELLVACEKQHINIMCILQNIVSKIRDGKRHLLLIGFPVPRIFGGDPEIISWKALYLPTVSYGKRTAKGFRNNQQGWWMRDRCEVFTKNAKLDWIVSENWNQHEISRRGKMSDLLLRKRILLIGAGCIGASIAEIFVRAGVYNITIADSDIFEVGNLSRHILNLNNIGEFKELSVCNYLNSLNPHANVKVINDTLSNDDSFKTNIDLDRYDVIVDCTGENNVLDILQRTNFKRTHIIASVSVGLGAKRLYVFNEIRQFYVPKCYNDKKEYVETADLQAFILSNSPFCVLDAIEFFAKHSISDDFEPQINAILKLNEIPFQLSTGKLMNTFDTQINKNSLVSVQEVGLKELLQEASKYYDENNLQIAVEKLWDAFERLKTYYCSSTVDKKKSVNKIIMDMGNNQQPFLELFEKEFYELTILGNNFRIRHHEITKTDIQDKRHYEYFYKRCLSLISTAIQYLDGRNL